MDPINVPKDVSGDWEKKNALTLSREVLFTFFILWLSEILSIIFPSFKHWNKIFKLNIDISFILKENKLTLCLNYSYPPMWEIRLEQDILLGKSYF